MIDVERVYIGGFEDARLSGTEIVDRLKSQLSDAVDVQDDVHHGSCFCHINVVSKKEGVSGLDSIIKLYHNVKWKGCKLRVEKAKPHLLERLEAERRERQNKAMRRTLDATPTASLPRFLKIKQRHGQECWKVDTRPIEVSDWKRFEKLRAKLAKQSQTAVAANATAGGRKPKPAIHFAFAPDVAVETSGRVDAAADEDDSASSTSSASSVIDETKGNYAWSDDDSSGSSCSSSLDRKAIHQNKLLKEPSMIDEFVQALDACSAVSGDSADDASSNSNDSVTGLEDEVERGLNVLAELFPGVNKTAHTIDKKAENNVAALGAASANVVMERYDPSQKSAEKYVISVSANEVKSHESDMSLMEESEALETEEVERIDSVHVGDASDVYEEKKLEAVFRHARESFVPVVATPNDTQDSAATFSFGFQVDAQEKQNSVDATTFEFSVNVKDQSEPANAPVEAAAELDGTSKASSNAEKPTMRRKLLFSKEELSSFVEDFFLLGDGPKIRDDLERYRGDEQIHEEWLQERKALTLDWKRKRKHAMSKQRNRHKA
ncbi:hypothetical protein MPSEU_000502100 [Mayamaea pseudoterrestris]|nr:hypothetical protein MPSEU_000502100 [Mayamaea pseudoterrestris]